ncbi:hypothetical protein I79_000935 [Cricetulus griseus]|uniref:Uncharacterized protein n=1 Tax=Cricetulus griseus TaxID=10029 RepID=G3GTF4_CRIGR|nr:hypothetical protein I79_000935 [Cricetulus griseus]
MGPDLSIVPLDEQLEAVLEEGELRKWGCPYSPWMREVTSPHPHCRAVDPFFPKRRVFKEPKPWGWGDGSEIKSSGCSSKGPEFNSSNHMVAHNHL